MSKSHTLHRSLLLALPLLLAVPACAGNAQGVGGEGGPTNDPTVAQPAATTAGSAGSAGSTGSTAQGGAETPNTTARGQALFLEAEREAHSLDPATSFYSHTTVMDENTGTRQTDCSGFVDYILSRVLPDALAPVSAETTTGRPLAETWYHYIASRPTTPTPDPSHPWWRRAAHPIDLVPGDLVMWLRPANVQSNNTGHIMVVTGQPRAGRDHEVIIPITDATENVHANDTRGTRTGIGSGEIGIQVNDAGEALAYYWKGGESTTSYPTEIAFAHLE
jgi:hypothetical protein